MKELLDRFYGIWNEAGGEGGGGAPLPKPKIGLNGPQAPQQQAQPDGYREEEPEYEAAPEQEPQEPAQPDWREQAIKDPQVRARFDEAMFGKQEPQAAPAPQEDPLDVAQRELDEIEAEMGKMGALKSEHLGDKERVTKHFELQDRRSQKASEIARLAASRSRQMEQRTVAERQVSRLNQQYAQQDPNFTEDTQKQFEQYLEREGISADILSDSRVHQTVVKSFLYEQGQQGGRRQKLPDPPLGQGHSRQPAPPAPKEPVDPLAAEKAQFWGTNSESVAKHNSTQDGRPLQYDKSGHDVPYLKFNNTGRRRRTA